MTPPASNIVELNEQIAWKWFSYSFWRLKCIQRTGNAGISEKATRLEDWCFKDAQSQWQDDNPRLMHRNKSPCVCGQCYLPNSFNFSRKLGSGTFNGQDKMLLPIHCPYPASFARSAWRICKEELLSWIRRERRCVPVEVAVSHCLDDSRDNCGWILLSGVRVIRIFNFAAVQVEPWFWKSWEVENKLCKEREGEENCESFGKLTGQQSDYYVYIIIVKVGCQKVKRWACEDEIIVHISL